jgi:Tfp pilus assembly protein PilF
MWYQSKGELDRAADTYRELIRFQPTQPLALFNLGYIALGKNQLDEAIQWFSRSWEANNLYADALFNRGYCFLLKGDKSRAKLDFQKTLEIDPKHVLAKARLSEIKS